MAKVHKNVLVLIRIMLENVVNLLIRYHLSIKKKKKNYKKTSHYVRMIRNVFIEINNVGLFKL